MSRFQNAIFLGDIHERIKILAETGQRIFINIKFKKKLPFLSSFGLHDGSSPQYSGYGSTFEAITRRKRQQN